jgi:Domain of unknown function (DUF4357)
MEDTEFEIYPNNKSVHAFMLLDQYTVRRGSTALLVGGQRNHYQPLAGKLIAKGSLAANRENPNLLEFTEDVSFHSSSAAASVVLGRQASGPLEWRKTGYKADPKRLAARTGGAETFARRNLSVGSSDRERHLCRWHSESGRKPIAVDAR